MRHANWNATHKNNFQFPLEMPSRMRFIINIIFAAPQHFHTCAKNG